MLLSFFSSLFLTRDISLIILHIVILGYSFVYSVCLVRLNIFSSFFLTRDISIAILHFVFLVYFIFYLLLFFFYFIILVSFCLSSTNEYKLYSISKNSWPVDCRIMEMDSDSDIEIPRKRQRTEMFTNECIICGEHGLKEHFCQSKEQESWTKLLEAATLRQFEKLLQYKEHPSVPDIYYHPECRPTFCHKKAYTKIKKEQSFSYLDDKRIETAQRPSREKPDLQAAYMLKVAYFATEKQNIRKEPKTEKN